jgi:predicted RNA-binding protein with PUA-like domain
MPDYFLAKSDPDEYSLADLERDGQTVWDGVTNAQAVKAIRAMKPGDRVLIYHSGGESAIVGLADVLTTARPDPNEPKSAVVDLQFVARLTPATTLAEIKQAGLFAEFALVKQGRLSTMSVPPEFIEWLKPRYPSVPW